MDWLQSNGIYYIHRENSSHPWDWLTVERIKKEVVVLAVWIEDLESYGRTFLGVGECCKDFPWRQRAYGSLWPRWLLDFWWNSSLPWNCYLHFGVCPLGSWESISELLDETMVLSLRRWLWTLVARVNWWIQLGNASQGEIQLAPPGDTDLSNHTVSTIALSWCGAAGLGVREGCNRQWQAGGCQRDCHHRGAYEKEVASQLLFSSDRNQRSGIAVKVGRQVSTRVTWINFQAQRKETGGEKASESTIKGT